MGTVYDRFHYAIDTVAGVGLALTVVTIVRALDVVDVHGKASE